MLPKLNSKTQYSIVKLGKSNYSDFKMESKYNIENFYCMSAIDIGGTWGLRNVKNAYFYNVDFSKLKISELPKESISFTNVWGMQGILNFSNIKNIWIQNCDLTNVKKIILNPETKINETGLAKYFDLPIEFMWSNHRKIRKNIK